jgi:acyl carrier protein
MDDQPSVTRTDLRSEEEVSSTIRELIMDLAPSPEAAEHGDARLAEDLAFHSLALLELAFSLEDEFDLPPIDEDTARRITTMSRVQEHVLAILRDRGALTGPGES